MTDAQDTPRGTLSVQMYTFRNAHPADPSATIAQVAGIGFKYIEPFGIGNRQQVPNARMATAAATRRALDDHGLRVSSVHSAAPYGPETEAILDELELIGANLAFASWSGEVHGFDRDALSTLGSTQRFADAMNEAAQNASRRGIRIGYHNHFWEWNTLENGHSAYETLLNLLDPAVFLEMDTYWVRTAGQNPVELLERFGDRVLALHIKDGPATQEGDQVPLGGGVVDYRAALLAAPSAQWHVLEMDRSAGDVFADVEQSAKRLIEEGLSSWE
ncbi:sugar phosphate isomerase/epimerase family protein [Deinococcus hopiensis]|uniref:Sugar phosphate isomerase/epimerase n=1 Tax=Deinococcus hopiensis KR-140 TaxID=695939 RepID=A0A1W1UTJ6_9DEIO|nr:sugar phosphate isomerase/epimerase [Deinococcus hopiensis]SMB84383.1 Sugar phosphate isomerase/epimerase [Deinococcus hopiensis KR-140]